MPSTWQSLRRAACRATFSATGMYGTVESSQVLEAWILATVFRPRWRAISQWRRARGPGPIAEREYSPTRLSIPPRWIGRLHSLTLIREVPAGSRWMIASAWSSGQPQSHTINRAPLPDWRMPAWTRVFTSAITSALERRPQRGQLAPFPCDQQWVRFSEAVIVNSPARSGTARQRDATDPVRYSCTEGSLVHSAA